MEALPAAEGSAFGPEEPNVGPRGVARLAQDALPHGVIRKVVLRLAPNLADGVRVKFLWGRGV